MADFAPYPFRVRPHLAPKVWGGRKLATCFGKDLPGGAEDLYGESWEVADLPEGQSAVETGPCAGQPLPAAGGALGGTTWWEPAVAQGVFRSWSRSSMPPRT